MRILRIILAALVIVFIAAVPEGQCAFDRVLLIGDDALSWEVITPMIERGELPNIKRLIDEGASGELATDAGCSPISWTSIACGKSMKKHGVDSEDFDFIKMLSSGDSVIKTKRIWDIAEEKGRTVGLYRWYFTALARRGKGKGFWVGDAGNQSLYPEQLAEAFKGVKDELLYLLDNYKVDFAAAYWISVDPQQHYYWFYHKLYENEAREKYPPEVKAEIYELADHIYAAYRNLDSKIGELLSRVKENDSLIIVSDHGFKISPSFRKNIKPRVFFLEKLGIFSGWSDEKHTQARGVRNGVKFTVRVEYASSYKSNMLKSGFLKYQEEIFPPVIRVTFDEAAQGRGMEEAKKEITEAIEGIIEDKRNVFVRGQSSGAEMVFELSNDSKSYCQEAREPKDTEFLEINVGTGDHGPDTPGVVILRGNKFRSNFKIQGAHLFDIAPTILYLMGLPVGRDMDGKVLVSAFKNQSRKIKYIGTYDTGNFKDNKKYLPRVVTEKEKRQLRSLGYIQ